MERKTFNIIITVSMVLIITVAALSIIGTAITGFYPGIIVFLLLAMISIASKLYAKKIIGRSGNFQKKYFTTATIINLLSILIVVWMTFVILVDHVFSKML